VISDIGRGFEAYTYFGDRLQLDGLEYRADSSSADFASVLNSFFSVGEGGNLRDTQQEDNTNSPLRLSR